MSSPSGSTIVPALTLPEWCAVAKVTNCTGPFSSNCTTPLSSLLTSLDASPEYAAVMPYLNCIAATCSNAAAATSSATCVCLRLPPSPNSITGTPHSACLARASSCRAGGSTPSSRSPIRSCPGRRDRYPSASMPYLSKNSRHRFSHPSAKPSRDTLCDCKYAASPPDAVKRPLPSRKVTTCAPLASAAASHAPLGFSCGTLSSTSNVSMRRSSHTCVPSASPSPRARARRSCSSNAARALTGADSTLVMSTCDAQKPYAFTRTPCTGATPFCFNSATTRSHSALSPTLSLTLSRRASSKEPMNAPLASHTCATTLTPAPSRCLLAVSPNPPTAFGSKSLFESPTCQTAECARST